MTNLCACFVLLLFAECRSSLSPARAGIVIPRLNLPQLQQPSWHLPMSAMVMPSCDSSEAGMSSSHRTATTSTSNRGGSMCNLTVLPLTTARHSCGGAGGADTTRSNSHSTAGPGPVSSRLGPGSARGSKGGWSGHRLNHAGHQDGSAAAAAAAAGGGQPDCYVPCTPVAAGAGGGSLWDPSQAPYAAHRAKCALYIDSELHVLCMELALHLLVTPTGQLDPVQLPHEPSGKCI